MTTIIAGTVTEIFATIDGADIHITEEDGQKFATSLSLDELQQLRSITTAIEEFRSHDLTDNFHISFEPRRFAEEEALLAMGIRP